MSWMRRFANALVSFIDACPEEHPVPAPDNLVPVPDEERAAERFTMLLSNQLRNSQFPTTAQSAQPVRCLVGSRPPRRRVLKTRFVTFPLQAVYLSPALTHQPGKAEETPESARCSPAAAASLLRLSDWSHYTSAQLGKKLEGLGIAPRAGKPRRQAQLNLREMGRGLVPSSPDSASTAADAEGRLAELYGCVSRRKTP